MAQSIANQPSPSQVSGRLATWHRVMEEAGLPYDALQWPIDDPGMRHRLVRFWLSRGCEITTSQNQARAIMGANFFGVEEAIQHFGVNPSQRELGALAEVPFTEEVLAAHRDTHILTAVLPMSILDIHSKVKADGLFYDQDDWYNQEVFAQEKGETGWRLVRKIPVANSTSKTWQEQQALLQQGEETPTVRVMVYAVIGHFKATGERLFKDVYVRCSDLGSDGVRIALGPFGRCGLCINYEWDSGRDDLLGLSSFLKF